MSTKEIITILQEKASENYKKNVIKLGIPEKDAIGVPTAELRKIAKKYPKDKHLVQELWYSGFHEAKLLAVLLMKPNDYTSTEIERRN